MNVEIGTEAASSFFTEEYFFQFSIQYLCWAGSKPEGESDWKKREKMTSRSTTPAGQNTGENDEERLDCIPVQRSKPEANIRGRGKTVHVVFKYLSRSPM
jgi:hypothetical protein